MIEPKNCLKRSVEIMRVYSMQLLKNRMLHFCIYCLLCSINLSKLKLDGEVVELVPQNVCEFYCILPVAKIGNALSVAMADPLNAKAQDDIRKITGLNVETFISTFSEIEAALTKHYK